MHKLDVNLKSSVQQNFVRSQKVEQTDGQEHSRTPTSIFAKAASNFLLRKICPTFLVDPLKVLENCKTRAFEGDKLIYVKNFPFKTLAIE